jgi:type 1 fimbria pilin
MTAVCSTSVAYAECHINDVGEPAGSRAQTINFSTPSTIDVAADGVGLNVVDVLVNGMNKTVEVQCQPSEYSGFVLDPSRGVNPSSGTVFPLVNTGLDLRLTIDGWSPFHSLAEAARYFFVDNSVRFRDGPYRLFLIKNREVPPGTVIPAGPLGSWKTSNGFVIANFNLMNSISIVASSCIVDSINVPMGDKYQLHQLSSVGDVTASVPFSLVVRDCGKGVNSVNVTFDTIPGVVSVDGIVPLDKESSASGVGLKLMTKDGDPIKIKQKYKVADFTPGVPSAALDLLASYIRMSGGVKAGTANASVRFTVSYM